MNSHVLCRVLLSAHWLLQQSATVHHVCVQLAMAPCLGKRSAQLLGQDPELENTVNPAEKDSLDLYPHSSQVDVAEVWLGPLDLENPESPCNSNWWPAVW